MAVRTPHSPLATRHCFHDFRTLGRNQSTMVGYSPHATLGLERELTSDWTVSADYSFIRGAHLVRPRNINQGNFGLISSYERACAVCPTLPGVTASGCSNPLYQGAGEGWNPKTDERIIPISPVLSRILREQHRIGGVVTGSFPTSTATSFRICSTS